MIRWDSDGPGSTTSVGGIWSSSALWWSKSSVWFSMPCVKSQDSSTPAISDFGAATHAFIAELSIVDLKL